jgi:hypothetical protein
MATLAVSTEKDYRDVEAGNFHVEIGHYVTSSFSDLEDHALDHPGTAGLTVEILNRFADGDPEALLPTDNNLSEIEGIRALIALVDWWTGMQARIDELWQSTWEIERPPAPGRLEAESARNQARRALCVVSGRRGPEEPGLPTFMKCYRLWTRSICEMGRKGWPGVDWSTLEKVV